ncbi:MAG TPA: permease prefix domain 1-containing protein, partial [Longimicrobiales bacterium]
MKERPRPGGRPAGRIRRASVTEDVEREVRAHLALATEELQADGWDPAEAKAEALRRFGDRERVARESVRISRSHAKAQERGRMMEAVWQD